MAYVVHSLNNKYKSHIDVFNNPFICLIFIL